jgi:hypothetical protein
MEKKKTVNTLWKETGVPAGNQGGLNPGDEKPIMKSR